MAQKIIHPSIISAAEAIAARPSHSDRPFFIFDADAALERVQHLTAACKEYFPDSVIAVSVKSCSLGIFLRLIAEEGLNAEVCSADEFKLALKAGFTGDRIILDGPYKNAEDLSLALNNGALVHIDSAHELSEVIRLTSGYNQKIGVGVRLSHLYSGTQRSRFGVTAEEFRDEIVPLLTSCPDISLRGFHLHTGSNLENPSKVIDSLRDWLPFLVKNMPDGGHLDMGSGFPADSFSPDSAIPTMGPAVFFRDIYSVLSEYDPALTQKWKLIFEPGRTLSEDHGYAVGKTVSVKNRYDSEVIQTNLGINWIPSIHNWHHSLLPLGNDEHTPDDTAQILAGFNCFENDCLFPKGPLHLKNNQLFIIRGCGAYDLQTANEWTRTRPPVYALLNQEIITARLPSPALPAAMLDLMHAEKSLCVDENIQLAPASSRFAAELFSVVDRNREEFSQYMAWPRFVKTADDESGFLDACLLAHQKNEGKTYVILFNDAAVGLLSFNSIDSANKTAYIGYWLDMRVQGQGVITRALNALVKEYSDQKLINRFVIKCSVSNLKSNEVAQRCGFVLEGKMRKAELLNGVFHDQNVYSYIAP